MKICMGCMNHIGENNGACPYCGYDAAKVRQESYYLKTESIIGGKYIVGRVLNYNGHAVSYMGLDAEANRKVVIKEYLPSDFSTRAEGEKEVTIYSGDAMEKFEQGLINFLNESNRIQQLSKIEGIAKVYDCFPENDTGYVVSEYIEGHTLKEILDSGKIFSPEEARAFISKILRGLCLVHPLNIIHCDISPDTIMITQLGEIKLLDFGATRYVTTENSKSLAIILKQGYAPEEQYRSQGVRGPWTDVYALGAVMYRMITGIVPQESVERMINDELKDPSQMGIVIPGNLENAMMNALNVYQPERTQSAEVFLRELSSPTVNRIQVKKRKRETGKIPLWTKGLVAGLLLMVTVGGVILYNLPKQNVQTVRDSAKTILLQDYCGKTMTAVDESITEINNNKEWNIKWEFQNVFDRSEEAGLIFEQNPLPNEDLYQYKDGKKTLKFSVYQNETIIYDDIKELKANQLSEKLYGLKNVKDNKIFKPDNEAKGKKYFDIVAIGTGAEKYSVKQLRKGASSIKINIKEIKDIWYFASNFIYIPKVPDYIKTYKTVDKLKYKKVTMWRKNGKGDKDVEETNSITQMEDIIDYYYILAKKNSKHFSDGQIYKQTVEKGKTYNQQKKDKLIYAIRKVILYDGKMTGKQLEQKIKEDVGRHVSIKYGGDGDKTGQIKKVKSSKKFFKDEKNVTITIWTEKKDRKIDSSLQPTLDDESVKHTTH